MVTLLISIPVNATQKGSLKVTPIDTRIGQPAPQIIQHGNLVVEWNRILLTIVRTAGAQPPTIHPTRSFAIMHAAIYDAVNTIDRAHAPYLVHVSGSSRNASPTAAAASAADRVLVELYPNFKEMLDTQLMESLAQVPQGLDKSRGIRLGVMVAERLLSLRSNDGADAQPLSFAPGTNPGDYQLTPPNFPQPVFTHWSHVTPFTLAEADQFRPSSPPPVASSTYATALNEVKDLGFINSATRSADQTQIGRFWSAPIQNYWNEIAQTAALENNLTLSQSARLFALLNLTLADSVIAFYDAKYAYHFWRPVTAIRAADSSINPETMPDPNWLPLLTTTPADPSYPGAHSVISSGAAAVLNSVLGDDFSFTVRSEVLPGVERSFTSFTAAAEEAGLSRIYAGVHFRFDHDSGKQLGQSIADYVIGNFLVPRLAVGESEDR
jgi:hypothetical protein